MKITAFFVTPAALRMGSALTPDKDGQRRLAPPVGPFGREHGITAVVQGAQPGKHRVALRVTIRPAVIDRQADDPAGAQQLCRRGQRGERAPGGGEDVRVAAGEPAEVEHNRLHAFRRQIPAQVGMAVKVYLGAESLLRQKRPRLPDCFGLYIKGQNPPVRARETAEERGVPPAPRRRIDTDVARADGPPQELMREPQGIQLHTALPSRSLRRKRVRDAAQARDHHCAVVVIGTEAEFFIKRYGFRVGRHNFCI